MNATLATLERIVSGQSACCSQTFQYPFKQGKLCTLSMNASTTCPRPLSRQQPLYVAAAGKPSRPLTKASRPQSDKGKTIPPGKAPKGKEQDPKRTAKQTPRPTSSPVRRNSSSPLNAKQQAASSRLPRPAQSDSLDATAVSTPEAPRHSPSTPEYEWLQQRSPSRTVPSGASGITTSASDPSKLDNPSPIPSHVNTLSAHAASNPHAPAEADEGEGTESDGFLALTDEAGSDDRVNASSDGDDEDLFPEIQLALPPSTNVKVKTAVYLQSCVSVSECPPPRFPEFAVIGRSNVGKSSLINMMTGRKDLAMVSKEPGKTKCINHFLINDSWYLVDLPGYGFAKVGLQMRQLFEEFTRSYFRTRPNLAMVLLLVDASVPPQPIDLSYANWLTDNEVPFALVFTKADKRRKGLSSSIRDSHVTAFKKELLRDLAFLPPSIMTSASKGLGRGELLNFISSLRVAFVRSGRLEAIRQGML